MAKLTGKLTDAAIRAAKPPPEGKPKLYDGTHLGSVPESGVNRRWL
jgi:hypothetical protein